LLACECGCCMLHARIETLLRRPLGGRGPSVAAIDEANGGCLEIEMRPCAFPVVSARGGWVLNLVGRMYNSRAQELQSSRAFSYVHKSIAMCAYFWHACRPSALSAALSARARVLMEANRAAKTIMLFML